MGYLRLIFILVRVWSLSLYKVVLLTVLWVCFLPVVLIIFSSISFMFLQQMSKDWCTIPFLFAVFSWPRCGLQQLPPLSSLSPVLQSVPNQPPDVNHKLTFIWLMPHFRMLITSSLRSTQSLKVNSFQKTWSTESTFQISDCTAVQRCDWPYIANDVQPVRSKDL